MECVTSVGPMDPKRIIEIESMTGNVAAGKIYVTAFLDFATFKKNLGTIGLGNRNMDCRHARPYDTSQWR